METTWKFIFGFSIITFVMSLITIAIKYPEIVVISSSGLGIYISYNIVESFNNEKEKK